MCRGNTLLSSVTYSEIGVSRSEMENSKAIPESARLAAASSTPASSRQKSKNKQG